MTENYFCFRHKDSRKQNTLTLQHMKLNFIYEKLNVLFINRNVKKSPEEQPDAFTLYEKKRITNLQMQQPQKNVLLVCMLLIEVVIQSTD